MVLEGRNNVFAHGGAEFSDAAASLKTVLREGSLQEKEGVSLGSEFSVLLPGIRTDDGAGLQWALLASDRKSWGAWHVNIGPELTRDGRGAMVMGGILEGPRGLGWCALLPSYETNAERPLAARHCFAQRDRPDFPGARWSGTEYGAYRHARERGGRPDEQVRAGLTF